MAYGSNFPEWAKFMDEFLVRERTQVLRDDVLPLISAGGGGKDTVDLKIKSWLQGGYEPVVLATEPADQEMHFDE
jgi:hypothetical protein